MLRRIGTTEDGNCELEQARAVRLGDVASQKLIDRVFAIVFERWESGDARLHAPRATSKGTAREWQAPAAIGI